jgi:ethanolamine ammonia-lyase large subunit
MAELDESIQAVLDGKYDLAAAVRKDDLRALMQDYQELAAKGDTNAATLGRTVLERAGTDPAALADLAFTIAANTENPNRDFGLADAALDQAVKAAGKETPRLIATRAIVRFESGKKEEGLALARKAVEATTDAQEKRVYENFVRVMESRLKAE